MPVAAATLIVFAAGAFSGTTLVWLVFAFGLAFVGIAVDGRTRAPLGEPLFAPDAALPATRSVLLRPWEMSGPNSQSPPL